MTLIGGVFDEIIQVCGRRPFGSKTPTFTTSS
jgi:hypothetical protein